MKKTIAILSLSAVVAASVQTASAHAFPPVPVYAAAVAYARPPVYTIAPAPAITVARVVAPAPVYVQPAPVVVYPRPVVVAPPVYVAPRFCAPLFSINLGFGYYHHSAHRHCW